MSNYGIPYQGSKAQIADDIIDNLPSGKRFVDLFGGGFAMSHCALLSKKYKTVYYNDYNPLIVDLVKNAIQGKYKITLATIGERCYIVCESGSALTPR